MKYIDLTNTFIHNMPVYPGDPLPELTQVASLAKDGYNDHQLSSVMHVGTHMDAPLHMIENGKYMSEIPVRHFFGRGVLLDVRGKKEVGIDVLQSKNIQAGDIVLLYSGLSNQFGEKSYYEGFPLLSEEFAQRLVSQKVHIVGLDFLAPDASPFPVHKILLGHGVLIIENLVNLDQLVDLPSFDIIALPVKIQADAAPVRVVAAYT